MSDLFSLTYEYGLALGFLSGFIAYFLGYALRLVFNLMRIE